MLSPVGMFKIPFLRKQSFMSQKVSQNFFKGYYFFVRFSSKVTFKKIVEEIKLCNFGKRDFEQICLEIDKIGQ
jgi:hypothetical protein